MLRVSADVGSQTPLQHDAVGMELYRAAVPSQVGALSPASLRPRGVVVPGGDRRPRGALENWASDGESPAFLGPSVRVAVKDIRLRKRNNSEAAVK